MASPENATLVASLRASLQQTNLTTIPAMRAWFEMTCGTLPVAPDVRCERVTAGVPAEWIRAGAGGGASDAALLYLHGGGYAIGSINTHRALVAELARAARVPALAIDYRLAPESPFPAAVEDATAAYRWLLARGIAPSRLSIAGDSAGGGLTIATLVALRDAGVPLPAAAVCFSPWIDLEGLGQSMSERASRDPLIQKERMLAFAAAYLGGKDPRTPLAAPLYADLTGLPPLLVQVGEEETLYDDAVRLVERARKSGVDVTLEAWAEMIHVWQLFAPVLPEGREALSAAGRFIGARLGAL
ncbi:MAG TPA: alpha/beta hydrolase [Candidatus Binatia bacterium]|jgi:acetyl esterase/lipase